MRRTTSERAGMEWFLFCRHVALPDRLAAEAPKIKERGIPTDSLACLVSRCSPAKARKSGKAGGLGSTGRARSIL